MLSPDEQLRYARQIMMQEIGPTGQEKLKQANILIAGVGGLGSAAALYLAAAGIGTIRVVDHDTVDPSNLNRQILHHTDSIGMSKTTSAYNALSRTNPLIQIEPVDEMITSDNAQQLADGVDMIVDALDTLETRLIINRAALDLDIPLSHGAVEGFEGRLTTIIPGKTACLKCIYKQAPEDATIPVVGVTPATVGGLQAMEVIKYIIQCGELLTNRLLCFDGLGMTFEEFKLQRNPECAHCGRKTSK